MHFNITLFSISTKHFVLTVYLTSVWSGLIKAWKQRSPRYRTGFVLRILFFGLAVRVGHRKYDRDLFFWDRFFAVDDNPR